MCADLLQGARLSVATDLLMSADRKEYGEKAPEVAAPTVKQEAPGMS